MVIPQAKNRSSPRSKITAHDCKESTMTNQIPLIRIGQFSESPHLAIARGLNLGSKYGIDWTTERVTSSPGQFESLSKGDIDLAITSPDNVIMYATTDVNPLKSQLDLQLLRPIDHGLGLALYTSQDLDSVVAFEGVVLGVDVMSSGFALLLLQMLESIGVDPAKVNFQDIGATPKRLVAITEGQVVGSILNAETAVAAEAAGLRKWATSTDISSNYLGTVLANMKGSSNKSTGPFLDMWEETTQVILTSEPSRVVELLEVHAPKLANDQYVGILQSKNFGVIPGDKVSIDQLKILAQIRAKSGAYTPSELNLKKLATHA